MEIRRFFSNKKANNDLFILDGDEFEHAIKVLRYKKGYIIIIADGSGMDYTCDIQDIYSDYLLARVKESKPSIAEPSTKIVLCQALPKGDKLDFVVQKAVELGVSEIYPFLSQNCTEKKFNLTRLRRVALEAAKQCGRAVLPIVHDLVDIDRLPIDKDTVLAYEDENQLAISNVDLSNRDHVVVVVGSEGGFTSDEARAMISRGAISVSLGKRILRAETASVVMTALVLYKTKGMDL